MAAFAEPHPSSLHGHLGSFRRFQSFCIVISRMTCPKPKIPNLTTSFRDWDWTHLMLEVRLTTMPRCVRHPQSQAGEGMHWYRYSRSRILVSIRTLHPIRWTHKKPSRKAPCRQCLIPCPALSVLELVSYPCMTFSEPGSSDSSCLQCRLVFQISESPPNVI
jgi:hypothetical protein